jgi:hypothetical protein
MKFAKRVSVCVILTSSCIASYAGAQSQPSQAAAKALVAQYVAAYNKRDAARLRALYDPKSQACITAENKDYYDATLALMWRDPIPANYTFTVSAVNEGNLRAVETFGRFLLKPQRELHIDYQQGDDSGTVVIYLVQENGRWLADQPCATEQAVKQFRDQAPARAHYKSIAAGIQDPLRSQLISLLREHKTGEAVERYMKASGQDGRTAILVIDQLALEARP